MKPKVPSSFSEWESEQVTPYLDVVENRLLPMEARLEHLKSLDDPDCHYCDEIFLLEEAIAGNTERRMDLEEVSLRVDRARRLMNQEEAG